MHFLSVQMDKGEGFKTEVCYCKAVFVVFFIGRFMQNLTFLSF